MNGSLPPTTFQSFLSDDMPHSLQIDYSGIFQSPVIKPINEWSEEDSSPCGVRYFPLAHRGTCWSLSPPSKPAGKRYERSPRLASSPSSRLLAAAFGVGALATALEDDPSNEPTVSPPPSKYSSGYQDSFTASRPPDPPSLSFLSPPKSYDLPSFDMGPYLGFSSDQEFLGLPLSPPAIASPPSDPHSDDLAIPIESETFHSPNMEQAPQNSRKRKIFEKRLIDFSSLSILPNHGHPTPSSRSMRTNLAAAEVQPDKKPPKFRRSRTQPSLSSPSFDWNKEYQRILEKPLLQRGALLGKLSALFEQRAKMIGEIIIRERNYPNSRKTIPPLHLGHCGGVKYRKDGIFFKFATDHDKLLGGDLNAMKVAGHELKGLTAFSSCGMLFGISFGLMALIDYRGYRLIATSELPISTSTIVYGSSDGGNTVHSNDPEINAIIERAAKILNLKGHMCGLNPGARGLIHGPCDLEGHIGTDGRFYILDLARVFPPQTPNPELTGGFLYQLLRPELVARAPFPLSPDAFSAFGACDPDVDTHNQEAIQTTDWLLSEVIPEFAAQLAQRSPPPLELASLGRLVKQTPRSGINIRFLGNVRRALLTSHSATEYCTLIMTELTARTLKHLLRSLMRKLEADNEAQYQTLVVNFFNQFLPPLLSLDDDDWPKNNYHLHIWKHAIVPLMIRLYALPSAEVPDVSVLAGLVSANLVFQRTQQLTGIRFSEPDRLLDASDLPLTQSDIDGIDVLIRPMYAVPRIEADGLVECGRHKQGRERRDYLSLATTKYSQVLELKPDDYVVLTNLGAVLVDLAKDIAHSDHMDEVRKTFRDAFQKFRTALTLNKNESQALSMWGNGLYSHAVALVRSPSHFPGTRSEVLSLLSESHQKYSQALAIDSESVSLRFSFGSLLLKQAQLLLRFPSIFEADTLDRCRALLDEADSHLAFVCLKSPQDSDALVSQGTVFLLRAELNPDSSLRPSSLDRALTLFSRAELIQPGSSRRSGYLNASC